MKEALDSILNQTHEDFELIISDNASTDRTQEICEKYASRDERVRYYRNEENVGAAKNYNRVFALATSEYFKWAAHDDIIAPTFLEKCLEALKGDTGAVLCFPKTTYINDSGALLGCQKGDLSIQSESPGERSHALVDWQIKGTDIYWAVFGLMRTKELGKTDLIGHYLASDQVLLMQLLLLGKIRQIPEPLYFRRDHKHTSMKKYRTPHARLAWFDPERKKRIIWPHWNLLFKHLSAVKAYQFQGDITLRCYHAVLRKFANEWRTLAGEFKLVTKQLAGSKL